uniref:Uncharacterized protein n=1 Tax=Arundo donax TaxID=35708 RepID=A0A0A8XQF7_ARUDO
MALVHDLMVPSAAHARRVGSMWLGASGRARTALSPPPTWSAALTSSTMSLSSWSRMTIPASSFLFFPF